MKYACPECGFVHARKLVRKREDREHSGRGPPTGGFRGFHGWKTVDACPECAMNV